MTFHHFARCVCMYVHMYVDCSSTTLCDVIALRKTETHTYKQYMYVYMYTYSMLGKGFAAIVPPPPPPTHAPDVNQTYTIKKAFQPLRGCLPTSFNYALI